MKIVICDYCGQPKIFNEKTILETCKNFDICTSCSKLPRKDLQKLTNEKILFELKKNKPIKTKGDKENEK